MALRMPNLREWFAGLSRIDKTFVVVLAVRIMYAVLGAAFGSPLPGLGAISVVFVIVAILFVLFSGRRLLRLMLWRVRHRLLATWVLVGVVPILLIAALAAQVLFVLVGQIAGYMVTNEITRERESVRAAASTLAWSVSRRGSGASATELTEDFIREIGERSGTETYAIVRAGANTLATSAGGPIREAPSWIEPGFDGLLKGNDTSYFAAYVSAGDANGQVDVFVYRPATVEFFNGLLPGIATVEPDRGYASAGGIDIRRTEAPRSGFTFNAGAATEDPDPDPGQPQPPAGRGWWDIPVTWLVLLPARELTSGDENQSVAVVSSRPSLIVGRLFSTFSGLGTIIYFLMLVTCSVLLLVEVVSVVFGATLTRSITRSVAGLYEGTRKVQTGDFSHRIAVRKTRDQLADLATSFNSMTERVERLIVEVKDKERLENELEIAREVQSQLFPKEFPRVNTLELWGGCDPARTVSGDYYDFISLSPDRAVVAIGDISGKGISAALLMAHLQSALRSQLKYGGAGEASPSAILSVLNEHLFASSPPEKYATFFLGVYGDAPGQLLYTNAGHLPPMLVRRGRIMRLAGDGFPVGMFPGIQYEQESLVLEPGDLLVGFTDGITETPDLKGVEFGDERLAETLIRNSEKPLDRIAQEVSALVSDWAAGQERHDDTTVVLARRL